MNNVEIRIRGQYDGLSEAEKRAADYFLKNPKDVMAMPVSELARKSGASSAAWVRLCKAIGYDGLKALRLQLFAGQVQKPSENTQDDAISFLELKEGTSPERILKTVVSLTQKAVSDTAQLLDPGELQKAADAVRKADSVRIFGLGASSLVAEDLYHKLLRIGINAIFCTDSHIQLEYSATMTEKSAAIFISDKGQTREIQEMLQEAKRCGSTCIGITRYEKSALSQKCDILLYTSSPEAYVRSGAMSSRIAQLMAADALFTVIASADYEKVREPLEKSYKVCRKYRITQKRQSGVEKAK